MSPPVRHISFPMWKERNYYFWGAQTACAQKGGCNARQFKRNPCALNFTFSYEIAFRDKPGIIPNWFLKIVRLKIYYNRDAILKYFHFISSELNIPYLKKMYSLYIILCYFFKLAIAKSNNFFLLASLIFYFIARPSDVMKSFRWNSGRKLCNFLVLAPGQPQTKSFRNWEEWPWSNFCRANTLLLAFPFVTTVSQTLP